jgi:hypothetical protein
VLQWIPSHCGVHDNEQADRLAKHGAGQQQQENPVCLTEMKTIIKSLFKTPQQQDSYHQLTRSNQTTICRLRTGHNRLNQHLNRVMKIIPSPMCSCGEVEQDTAHILQTCRNHQALREEAITNNTPGDALWTRGWPTEDHQIRSGNWTPSVKTNKKKKKKKTCRSTQTPDSDRVIVISP